MFNAPDQILARESYVRNESKSTILAYIFFITPLGGLGFHNFYLGKPFRGLVELFMFFLSCFLFFIAVSKTKDPYVDVFDGITKNNELFSNDNFKLCVFTFVLYLIMLVMDFFLIPAYAKDHRDNVRKEFENFYKFEKITKELG